MIGVFVEWSPGRKNTPGYVIDGNGCHIWIGSLSSTGYGRVRYRGRDVPVHRVRYEREVGPIPPGLELDHIVCDNGTGGCCNPLHCTPATHKENVLRGRSFSAVNAAKTHCEKGHPLAGDNLAPGPLRQGIRRCRVCRAEGSRARRRARKTVDRRRGELNPKAKLTEQDVADIRAALAVGGRGTAAALARRFGVGHAQIWRIKTGRGWA